MCWGGMDQDGQVYCHVFSRVLIGILLCYESSQCVWGKGRGRMHASCLEQCYSSHPNEMQVCYPGCRGGVFPKGGEGLYQGSAKDGILRWWSVIHGEDLSIQLGNLYFTLNYLILNTICFKHASNVVAG